MSRVDWSLYLVADSGLAHPRDVLQVISAAVRGGVTCVQIREKTASTRSLCALTAAALHLLHGSGVPVLVDDRLDVALAVGADGVHLGQDDLPVEAARRIAGPDALIGLSTAGATDVAAAAALPAGTIDYLGIGPIFQTSTKPDAKPVLGPALVADLRRLTTLPCVGIGGITVGNAASAIRCGLDGVAVVSAICAAADPAAAAAALTDVIVSARRSADRRGAVEAQGRADGARS